LQIDRERFELDGFAIVKPFLPVRLVTEIIGVIESHAKPSAGRGGTRDVMDVAPEIAALAGHPGVRSLAEQVLGPKAVVVRATLFDKTDAANWKVPWHQDVTIAVASKVDVAGYGPWSVKQHVHHVQPPAAILQNMVTVRIHLDPCPCTNGALRVMPGTHSLGKLNQDRIHPSVNEGRSLCCEVEAGGALVMRPLLLHASAPATSPDHRRVVHFDFAHGALDGGLVWRMAENA
jgi:ectoine hydroxylase-related dioxygenase (phytanoyl-CoA dioxygenase family)